MQDEARIAAQLRALGERVVAEQQVIMRAWRQSVGNDAELKTARTLSRTRFDDYIPALLRAFARQLAAWPGEAMITAEAEQEQRGAEHGAHRWQEGYALPEVAREWTHLHLVLLDMFEQHAAAAGADPSTMVVARRLLALLNGEGVSRSVTEYSRLMQAAAAGRVRDLEAALAQLNELQRQRSDAWREAAHDLRNSVGLVSNATGILRREDAPDRLRAQSLAVLQNGVSSLATMLNDLLTLARLEAGQEQRDLTEFDAGRLLSDLCARMHKDFAARGLFLHVDGVPVFTVQGDEGNTRRIAQNLLQNALRSTRNGGVTVRWSAAEEGDFRRWVLTVQDTGSDGHTAAASPVIEELRQIAESKTPQRTANDAEPSRTAAPLRGRGHGEGIGLSIVKHLCELLDARLEFSTDGAGGSTFRVVLPARYDQQ